MSSSEELHHGMASLTIAEQGDADQSIITSSSSPSTTVSDPENLSLSGDITLTKFTRFPDLPKELRLKIWKHTAFVPRNIDLWIGQWNMSRDNEEAGVNHFPHYFFSTSATPAILHTCHESREEGLSQYTLEFGVEYDSGPGRTYFKFSTQPTIYINWVVDTLCIMNPEKDHGYRIPILTDIAERCKAGELQSLAFDMRDSFDGNGCQNFQEHFQIYEYVMMGCRYPEEMILFLPASEEVTKAILSQNNKFEFKACVQNDWKLTWLDNSKQKLQSGILELFKRGSLPYAGGNAFAEETRLRNPESAKIQICELVLVDVLVDS